MALDKGYTIVKNGGKVIPDDLIEKVLQGTSALSAVSLHAGDGHYLMVGRRRGEMTMPKVKTFQEGKWENQTVTLFFQHGVIAMDEDMQPFTLLKNDEGQPILVAFLDGNFSAFEQTESTHTPEYHAIDMDIRPRIEKLYKMLGKDLPKLMEELKDPMTYRDIGNTMVGDQGSITFISADKTIYSISVATDTRAQAFDFGWVSDVNGYMEATPKADEGTADDMFGDMDSAQEGSKSPGPAATPPPSSPAQTDSGEPSKPTKPGRNNNAKASVPSVPGNSGAQPNGSPQSDPGTQQPGKAPEQPGGSPETGTLSGEPDPNEILSLKIPEHLIGDAKRVTKYVRKRTPGEIVPPDVMSMTHIRVRRADANKTFMQEWLNQNKNGIKAVAEVAIPKTETAIPRSIASTEPIKQPTKPEKAKENGYPARSGDTPIEPQKKDVTSHHIGNDSPGILDQPLPIMGPKQIRSVLDRLGSADVKNKIAAYGQVMSDPKLVKEMEDKIPAIHTQLGLKSLGDTMNWSFEVIKELGKDNPDFAATLAINWRNEALAWMRLWEEASAANKENGAIPAPKQEEPVQQKATGTDGPRNVLVRDKTGESSLVPTKPQKPKRG